MLVVLEIGLVLIDHGRYVYTSTKLHEHNMHDWNGRTKAQLSTGAHSFLRRLVFTLAGQMHCSYIQHIA